MLTNQDVANLFNWNLSRKFGEMPTDADRLGLYCQTSSSEMHEMHDCLENEGVRTTRLGKSFSLWSAQGFVDMLVSDWIKVYLTAQ